jgi:tetratricopeptide (TPR) repeat protein
MRWKGPAAVGGLLAIAASLVLVVFNRGSAVDPLVAIVGDARVVLARPTGGFHYGPLRSPLRGATETDDLQLAAEVARLRERAVRSNASAADLHAYGVGQLISGDAPGAIDSLQAAVRAKPGEAAYVADLGAAYMSRFVDRGEASDATAALEQLEKATALDPSLKEAWFNKALLLELMTRPADALAAWQTYLSLPDVQNWRDEAIRKRDALQGRGR